MARSQGSQEQKLKVKNPHRWDIGKGYLYTLKSELVANGKVVDEVTTTTGFRDVRFDAKKGFFLNGKISRSMVSASIMISDVWERP